MGIAVIPAPGGGVTQKVDVFTSTGTWTAPSNCSAVEVFLVGGGGGAGYINNQGSTARNMGSGGGGGEVVSRLLPVTPGASYTVTIGGGGSAGANTTSAGAQGSNSSFGSLLTATGGGGGASSDPGQGQYSSFTRGGGGTVGSTGLFGNPGGGAGGPAVLQSAYGSSQFSFTVPTSSSTTNQRSISNGITIAGANVGQATYIAGPGIQGFGNGGGGGYRFQSSSPASAYGGMAWTGTGYPSYFDEANNTRINGVAPTANTGDGGHGATTINSSGTGQAGTNGASGYCRVVYWS